MLVLYLGPKEHLEVVRSALSAPHVVLHAADAAAVDAAIADCDAILDAAMVVRFDAARLQRAQRLRVVATATTGADHIDAAALAERGIPLMTLRGERELLRNLTPAAEHSWLLMMACARRLIPAAHAVHAGQWDRTAFPGLMLRGKTLGIIGCGRIGQWMARYAEAFGMTRLGFDPHVEAWPAGIERCDLTDLLDRSDIVTIHVPLNDATRGMIGAAQLARLRPHAMLINTSRGEVCDERALLAALEQGRLAAAALDVLTGEPDIARHPLCDYARTHANLIITPHIGGFSPEAVRIVLEFSGRRIRKFFEDAHG